MKLELVEFWDYEEAEMKLKEVPYAFSTIAEDQLVECFILNDFVWDGSYHQNGHLGTPVFEIEFDGKKEKCYWSASFRYWGGVMARARSIKDGKTYDYMDFYCCTTTGELRTPKSKTDFIKPKTKKMLLETIICLLDCARFLLDNFDWESLYRKRIEEEKKFFKKMDSEFDEKKVRQYLSLSIEDKREFIPKMLSDCKKLVEEQEKSINLQTSEN